MITRQAIFRSWPFTNNNSNRRRNNVYEIIDVCILCMIWQILRNICWEMIFCTSHHPCIVILFCVIWVVSWAGGEQVELVLPSVACPWLTHCLVRSRYPSISLFIHRFRSFSTTYDQKKHNEIEGETHVDNKYNARTTEYKYKLAKKQNRKWYWDGKQSHSPVIPPVTPERPTRDRTEQRSKIILPWMAKYRSVWETLWCRLSGVTEIRKYGTMRWNWCRMWLGWILVVFLPTMTRCALFEDAWLMSKLWETPFYRQCGASYAVKTSPNEIQNISWTVL